MLAGCATVNVTPPPEEARWAARRALVSAIRDWRLEGRIAANDASDGWSASLRWEQRERAFEVDLLGPLGQGRVQVAGDAGGVTLRAPDGRVYRGTSADTLIEDLVAVPVPVDALRYWVRGLPAPHAPSKFETDRRGRLRRLEQDGWVVEFPSYARAGNLDMPERVEARRDRLRVRLAIRRWELGPLQAASGTDPQSGTDAAAGG